MRQALERSAISPASIGYVNAHGTATPVNDAAEGAAIARLFGSSAPVSSTKSMHAHLLGGSGALEAVITILALRSGFAPENAGLETPDRALEAAGLTLVKGSPARIERPAVLSNSFGFGGGNVVLVFARADEEDRPEGSGH
jgi:3-oxoacyl-(acyl-carrier-protein) synthase